MSNPIPPFLHFEEQNPHFRRMREILATHPEVKDLMQPAPVTAVYAAGVVAFQLSLAYLLRHTAWWWVVIIAYAIGAIANHALYVIIHECTHNLVFKSPALNRLLGIFVNLPLAFPSAIPFAKYHMLHHTHQADYEFDADLPGNAEARWVGHSAWRKTALLIFFSVVQGFLRPHRLKQVKFWDAWILLNFVVQFAFVGLAFAFTGWMPLLYLALSTFFGIGLHPLGGRWIQEHYVLQGGEQETYSYYGPLNKVCFNMGYHNEHHDFMKVPWTRLPALKKTAPEFYDTLISYRSWTWVLYKFISDPNITLLNRVARPGKAVPEVKDAPLLEIVPT